MFELARKFIILFSSKLTGKRETEQGLRDLESAAKKLEKSTSGLSEQQKKLGEVSAEAGKKQSIYANMMKRLEFQHKAVTRLLGENTRCIAKNITVTRDGYRVTTTYTNGMKVLSRTMTFTKDGFKKVGTSIRDIGERLKTSTPLMEQFIIALKRVAIVLPVWWTARQVMMNFINTIQDGIRYLYEMDKAFTKASLVVHTWGDVNEVNERLKEGFKDLARVVGESSTTIATSFYRFGTLGIESSKAWLGAQASIKQAIATMGDIDTISRANALAISLLGDTLGDYLPLEERLNFFTAKQVVLWRRNLMEANEFAGALERFLPTAKTLNLTLDQTLALLATLHSAGVRSCYDKETEILTDKGWKKFENLDGSEKVLTKNPETGELFYVKPIEYVRQRYKGKMLYVKNRYINFMVTPNHKVWLHKGRWSFKFGRKKFELYKAEEVAKFKDVYYDRANCYWKGKEEKYFVLPSVEKRRGAGHTGRSYSYESSCITIPMNLWLEFLGYYLSEGWCDRRGYRNNNGSGYYGVFVSQEEGKRARQIEKNLKKISEFLGVKLSKRIRGKVIEFKINNKQLWNYVKDLGDNAKEKRIPSFIKNLPSKQIKIFLDAFSLGDGKDKEKLTRRVKYIFATASTYIRDDLMDLALRCGYASSYRKNISKRNNTECITYHINVTTQTYISFLNSHLKNSTDMMKKEWVDYDGYVYCVEIPTKWHLLFVRRNGKTIWSGNTRAGRLLGTMFLKFVDNLGEVGRELGVVVKRGEDTFTVLRKVLKAFYEEWKKTGGHLSYELNRLFKQIFGGVRSQQVARALTVMHDVLEKNIDLINAEGIPTTEKVRRIMEEYEKQLDKVVDSYHKLMDVHKVLKKQLGEELVKAFQQIITGSEDHKEAIRRLNAFYEILLKTVRFMEKHSTELNAIFIALGIRSIPVIVKGVGSLSTRFKIISRLVGVLKFNLKKLVPFLTSPWTATAAAITAVIYAVNKFRQEINKVVEDSKTFRSISENTTQIMVEAIKASKEIKTSEDLEKFRKKLEELRKALDEYKKFAEKGKRPEYFAELPQLYKKLGDFWRLYRQMKEKIEKEGIKAKIEISPDLREQLNLLDKSVKYIRMQALGYNPIIIAQEKLNDYIDEMVGEYNEIIRKSKEKLGYVTREQVLTLLASKNYTKIKELLNLTEKDEKKILKARQLQLDVLKQQMNLIKSYSSQLRSTFQSALTEFLKTQEVDKFFDNIRNRFSSLYYESVSKYITSVLESSTGIFEKLGTFFAGLEFKGTMGEPILRASEIGSQRYYSAIVEASEVGSKLIEASASKMRDPFVPPLEYIKAMEGNKKATEEVAKKMRDPFVPPPEYIRIMEGNKKATEELSREIKKSTTIAKTKAPAVGFGGREMALPSWFPFSIRLNRLAAARPHLFNLGVGALATGIMTGNWQGALTSFIGSALMTVNPFLGLGFMLVSSLFRRKRITRTTSWTNPQQAKNLLPYLGITPAPIPEKVYALPSCFDDKTEILTDKGWKYFKDLTYDDKVLSLGDKGKAYYYPIKKIIKERYKGKMYLYEGKEAEFCVTPNHRFLVFLGKGRFSTRKGYQFIRIDEIMKKLNGKEYRMRMKRDMNWVRKERVGFLEDFICIDGKGKKYFKLGNKKFPLELWLRFLAWVISEGCVGKKTNEIIIGQKKRENINRIRELLNSLGFYFSEYKRKNDIVVFVVRKEKEIRDFLIKEVGFNAKEKRIPRFITFLSKNMIKIFLEEYLLGDGSIDRNGKITFYTASKYIADTLQELIIKSGKYGNLYVRKNGGSYIGERRIEDNRIIYYLHIMNTKEKRIATKGRSFIVKTSQIKEINYNGYVYDVEVEPYHTIYVRRNGKCMWSGNSYTFVSNITVHVDKVQGERPDIVNEIAKNVTNAMEEKVAQNYYHSLLRSVRPKTVGF